MELNFVYCFDDNYNYQALTSIKSILDKVTKKANIFIIHKNIKSFNQISNLISDHENLLNLYGYQFDSSEVNFPSIKSHFTEATFYRLFISQYLPKDIEFLVYLDADIICVNDPTSKLLETFSQINSENSVVAARVERTREQNNTAFNRLNLRSDDYFNAGVLIINFSEWIKKDVESNLLKILNLRFDDLAEFDQDILNIYFDGQITKFNDSLNYHALGGQNEKLYSHIEKNVCFLHYQGKGKPWSVENFIYSTSRFYQKEYKKLGFKKPHLIFQKNISTINKFLKLLFSPDFKNYENRFKFLKYSFIAFFTKHN